MLPSLLAAPRSREIRSSTLSMGKDEKEEEEEEEKVEEKIKNMNNKWQ